MAARARRWFGRWLFLAALWLLLVSKIDTVDLVAAAVTAAIIATIAQFAARLDLARFHGRLAWVRFAARLPGRVLTDTVVVSVALGKRLLGHPPAAGTFREIPFDPGGDDAESAARRALVIAGISLSPNSLVVALDADRGVLVIHHLVPTPETPGGGDRKWPL